MEISTILIIVAVIARVDLGPKQLEGRKADDARVHVVLRHVVDRREERRVAVAWAPVVEEQDVALVQRNHEEARREPRKVRVAHQSQRSIDVGCRVDVDGVPDRPRPAFPSSLSACALVSAKTMAFTRSA